MTSTTTNRKTTPIARLFASVVIAIAMACCALGASVQSQQAYADEGPAITAASTNLAAASDTTTVTLPVTYGQTEARSMLAMINEFRTGSDAWEWDENDSEKVYHSGLQPLAYDYELERVAMLRAAEIAISFSHTRLDGVSNAWDAFSGWTYVGENIAVGYGTAESAFVGWQETDCPYSGQGHRRNMLSEKYKAVGIGHAVCNGYHFWVQVFSAPVLNATATTADDSARDVQLTVSNSIIAGKKVSVTPTVITLRPGESAAMPTATVGIKTADTWRGLTTSVKGLNTTWSNSDPTVASTSSGKIVANKVGSTTITASVEIGTYVSAAATVEVVPWDMANATVAGISSVTYNGSAYKPAVSVSLGGKALVANTDYTVAYANNVAAGTATVTITGKGNYSGTKTATFAISRASVASAAVTGLSSKTFTGKAISQAPAVKLGSVTLKANTDYTVAFKNNKNAGTATVTITGKGNYSGTKTATFKIAKAANKLKASAKAKTLTVKYNKKKAVKLAKTKAFKITGAKGKVTFAKISGTKKITVSKAGKVTVAKKTKKGTYKVKVKVTAAGNSNYKKATKKVTLKIKVK